MITNFKIFEMKNENENWNMILDISNIWSDSLYENNNELISFNDKYINFLNKNKNNIIGKISNESWNDLEVLLNRLNENKEDISKSTSIWDDIYDWADSNNVQIKVEKEEIKKDF